MEISLLGYKINLQLLIFIGVLYLILVGHTFCSCCSVNGMGMIEGLATMAATNDVKTPTTPNTSSSKPTTTNPTLPANKKVLKTQTSSGGVAPHSQPEEVKVKAKVGGKEGFTGANINDGQSSSYTIGKNDAVNTASWFQPNLNVTPGQPVSSAVNSIVNRPNGNIPLQEGEMFLFQDIPFSPECCPNAYSSSMGCACMNTKTYNYLVTRGGNNVPYSEY